MVSHQEYMLAHAGEVGRVVDGWLSQEVVEADQGRNSFMSEFADEDQSSALLFSIQAPSLLAKARSHRDRFGQFVGTLIAHPVQDEAFARVAFASLMYVSGGRRWETLLKAESVDNYREMRQSGEGIGVDTGALVQDAYRNVLRARRDPGPEVRLHQFSEYAKHTNDTIYGLAQNAAAIALASSGCKAKEAIQLQRDAQTYGIIMAARTIGLAAEFRGGLEKVPLLEPRSITDAGLYYPFQQAA